MLTNYVWSVHLYRKTYENLKKPETLKCEAVKANL